MNVIKILERYETSISISIVCLAVVLRLIFASLAPAWQSPDEYPHYWVASQTAETGQLPVSTLAFPRYEAFQPPFSYLANGLLLWSIDAEQLEYRDDVLLFAPTSLLALRFLNILFALLTLLIVLNSAKDLFPHSTISRIALLGFVAFLPTYLGTSSTVNNDTLAILFATATVYFLVKFQLRKLRPRQALGMVGLCLGLGLATKLNVVILVPVALWMILLDRNGGLSGGKGKQLLYVVLGALPGVLILIVRNVVYYDSLVAVMPGLAQVWTFELSDVIHSLRNLFWSFWSSFGRLYEVHPPAIFYLVTFLPICVTALVGLFRKQKFQDRLIVGLLVSLLIAIVISLQFTLAYPVGTTTSWGKNLYPMLLPIGFLLVSGLGNGRKRGQVLVLASFLLFLLIGSIWGLEKMVA